MRLTAIGHADLAIMNPLSEATLDEVIERCDLPASARVLDLGCGKAEALIRVVERYACSGVGVEISPYLTAEARAAAELVEHGSVEIVQADARSYRAPAPQDLVMAMGPGWEHAGVTDLTSQLRPRAATGGLLLLADGYWRRPPTDAFLKLLGASRDEMASHEETIRAGIDAGLTPLWATTATDQDWDRYEWSIQASFDRWLEEHTEDPQFDGVAEWADQGLQRYLGGGRDQLGFGVYLFRLPA